ncbi:MAG: protein kinase domain-containing protein [Thermoanaerobaculia bacterium]
MTLPVGTRLGSFEVLAPLGAGGMGEVYRAKDLRLGREVALKVLPQELSENADRLARFEQEARSASALNHPNIVTIHEIGRAGDTAYIAMELVDGKTLRELAAPGPMPVRKVLAAAAQAAEGLSKAHGAGIVHRDLKPENLMVSRDGFVKILDFGLAKLTEPESGGISAMPTVGKPETRPGTVMGTVGYMSPEQAGGAPLDFRSDQFSLGSILYELLSGEKAFARKTAAETMSAIIREEPEPLGKLCPQTPLPLRWIVERCLAKDPEERYASTRDLARDLAGVRDHVSEIGSGGEVLTPAPARSRARLLRAAAALGLLAAGLAAGWVAARGVRKPAPAPSFHRLTFRQGQIANARFAPDAQTVIYGATWEGESGVGLYQTRPESPESRRFEFPDADILAISSAGEMALLFGEGTGKTTLARVPLSGGAPRPVLEGARYAGADWAPGGKDLAVLRKVEGRDRLEAPIGRVLFETKGRLESPRFSPKGDEIALFHVETSASLLLVETSGRGRRVLSTGWEGMAGAPCWTADGREIWFTASRGGENDALYAVDRSGRDRLIARVPGTLELDDISADGRALLAHHTMLGALMGQAPGETGQRDLSWLDWSFPTDLSADGKSLILTERGEGGGKSRSVYMRGTDGSPAVLLGEGESGPLSPDGKWVVSILGAAAGAAPKLVLLQTGAGETRPLSTPGLENIGRVAWLPDGQRLLILGTERGRAQRLYLQDIATGSRRPVTAEGVVLQGSGAISPDGKLFVGADGSGKRGLYPVEGGEARPIPGLLPREIPVQWTPDGRALYLFRRAETPVKVWLLDLETGQRRLWKEIRLEGRGVGGINSLLISRDGRAYVYSARSVLSELYLVEGLK